MARTKDQVLKERMGRTAGGDVASSSGGSEEIELKEGRKDSREVESPSGSMERKGDSKERKGDDGTPKGSSSSSSEGEEVKKRPKRKKNKKTVTKVSKKQPSDEELRKRYLKKKKYDAENAARKRKETAGKLESFEKEVADLKAQLKTARLLALAVDQYYAKHQLEGLLTEAVRKVVLQWVMRAAGIMM